MQALLGQRLAAALEGLELRGAAGRVIEAPALEAGLDLAGEALGVALRSRGRGRSWLLRGERGGRRGRRRPRR